MEICEVCDVMARAVVEATRIISGCAVIQELVASGSQHGSLPGDANVAAKC